MSEAVPAGVNRPAMDGSDSRWKSCYEALQQKFFNCTEKILGSLADFQKQLLEHLNEMTELNSLIAKWNPDLAMKLSNFGRGICQIRDYYDRIIASTKTLVNYGCNQKVILHIKDLMDGKRYPEAREEINGFFYYLDKLIIRVDRDIESWHKDQDLKAFKDDIVREIDAIVNPTVEKQHEVQVSLHRVFKLGTSTLVCLIAGAASGMVVGSYLPQDVANMTEAVTSVGSEMFSFCANSVLTGLQSAMKKSDLTQELRKQAESNIRNVCHCLIGLFDQLNYFQSNIGTIEKIIDELKDDIYAWLT